MYYLIQESELDRLTNAREAENKYIREQNEMEIAKSKEISVIDVDKFKNMVGAIGSDTLRAMAAAGPEMQVKLLQGLGIQSTLITDGTSPINLFNTANGLMGIPAPQSRKSKRRLDEDEVDDDDM